MTDIRRRAPILLSLLLFSQVSCGILWNTQEGERQEVFFKLEEYIKQHSFAMGVSIHNPDTMAILKDELSKFVKKNREIIVEAAKNFGNTYEQALAVFALGFLGEKDSYAILSATLEKAPANVRRNALGSIGIMAEDGIIKLSDVDKAQFQRLLEEGDYEILISTLFALQSMIKSADQAGEVMGKVRKFLSHPHPLVRNEAVILLHKAKDLDSYNDVLKLRFEMQPIIRKNVASALGGLRGEDAAPDLIEFLRDPNAEVVAVAHQTLIKVTGKNYGSSYQLWKERYEETVDNKLRYYTCSLHPDVHETSESRCKVCKRRLVAKELIYTCEDHPSVQLRKFGECPECKKKLVLRARPPDPDTIYYCKKHREIIKFEEGKCDICQEPLEERGDDGEGGEEQQK